MDDRPWYLAASAVALAAVALLADVVVPGFDVPAGLWGFLTAILGFLGGAAAIKARNETPLGRTSDQPHVDNDEHLTDPEFFDKHGYRRR